MHTNHHPALALATALLSLSTLVTAAVSGQASEAAPFADATATWGLDFVHQTGASGEMYFPEIVGSGAGLLDFDNDGDLDLYLVQSGSLGPTGSGGATDRLYENVLDERTGGRRFVDVTEASGIRAGGYGMGVACGDYDRNGFVDLYVTNFGSNQLWRNNGDGTFTDATATAGVGDRRWSVPAVFFDYDADGFIDLYVGNYADFRMTNHRQCFSASGRADYCAPVSFGPEPDRLFRNLGDGRFEDRTIEAGLDRAFGYALGAMAADLDRDGLIDLYVANDGVPNQMWINQGDGGFVEDTLLSGSGVNAQGKPEASMGVDIGDFDADGDLDLFMTHLVKETNTLYVNDGAGMFSDRTRPLGLAEASYPMTAFGTAFVDYDNDGWLDLAVVNGAVAMIQELVRAGDPSPYHQPNQLFRNLGGSGFEDVTLEAGEPFSRSESSRGLALGDLDNDGDIDAVLTNNRGPARVLENRVGSAAQWIGLRLVDGTATDGTSDVVGATALLRLEGSDRRLLRSVRTAGSYASSHDPRLLFGLGAGFVGAEISAEVTWPGGSRELWTGLPTATYTELRRGTGEPVKGTE